MSEKEVKEEEETPEVSFNIWASLEAVLETEADGELDWVPFPEVTTRIGSRLDFDSAIHEMQAYSDFDREDKDLARMSEEWVMEMALNDTRLVDHKEALAAAFFQADGFKEDVAESLTEEQLEVLNSEEFCHQLADVVIRLYGKLLYS